MSGPAVAVAGGANMDLIATAPALPRPGETMLGHDFAMLPGGKGANQAIAAVRAGARCTFLGAIGSDSFGVTLRARLTASRVDTSLTRVAYGISGVALVMVGEPGENLIVTTPGANDAFLGLTDEERAAIGAADVLVAQLEVPVETVRDAAVAARAAGTTVVLNAAPARPIPPELFAAVDLLVVNEIEAAAITGSPDPAALLAHVPQAVLTRGAAGAWHASASGVVHVPAPAVQVVDATAAGDAFTAALAVAWAEGRSPLAAVRWASAAGAACVRTAGSSNALPSRADIDQLYAETYA